MEQQVNRIRLTGLWKNETKDGEAYLAGSLGGGRLLIFRNKRKGKDADPDYSLFIVPAERKQQAGDDRGRPEPAAADIPF